MNAPISTRPVTRSVLPMPPEESTGESFPGQQQAVPDHDTAGVQPLGYQECYSLRGAAREMCLSRYY
jgi:hypothetical protein